MYTTTAKSPDDRSNIPLAVCDPYEQRRRRTNTTKHVAAPPRHPKRKSANKVAAANMDAASAGNVNAEPAAYYNAEYDDVSGEAPLPVNVWFGAGLVFTGHMDVANPGGDVLPALGGWFEYSTPLADDGWSSLPSNQLPAGARKLEPFTYKFQLWKPANEYS